jgi:integrase/recombinase XerD
MMTGIVQKVIPARITPILFKSKKLADGSHPIMIRVHANGVRKYITTGQKCKPQDWDAKKSCVKPRHPDHVQINLHISQMMDTVNSEVFELKKKKSKVTADRLLKVLAPDAGPTITVLKFWEYHIAELKKAGQIGTSMVHKESRARFSKFLKGRDISFEAIDTTLLQKYAVRLRADGMKDTSIHLRFRDLRAIYRRAASRRIVNMMEYPFGGKNDQPMKFWIGQFKTVTRKRAIGEASIRKIISLEIDPVNDADTFNARHYFMLSYYMGGMPWADMIRIRWRDIDFDSQSLTYIRVKTNQPVHVNLSQPAINILNYYHMLTGRDTNNYALPVLNYQLNVTQTQIRDKRQKVLKNVNRSLHTIEERIGLPSGMLTSYVARHTAATQAKRKGATKEQIGRMMNHHDLKTTDIYVDSLPSDDDIHGLLIIE